MPQKILQNLFLRQTLGSSAKGWALLVGYI